VKYIGLITFLLLINLFRSEAQTSEKNSLNEFNSGKIKKFSTSGLDKAKGLKLQFKYPASWKSIDGERPHVVRKFAQSDDYVLSLILINTQEQSFTQQEIDELFTTETFKSMIPADGIYLRSNTNMKIEGLKAGSIEFTRTAKRMDRLIYSHNESYFFIYKQYFVSIQFMVLNKDSESNSHVDLRFKEIQPLFYKMFNSIVIDNIWE